jgi:hypothetical protein
MSWALGSLTLAKIHIGRWLAVACAAVLLISGAVLLGKLWEMLWKML